MKFVVIDVETANPDYSSICRIGIVEFSDGGVKDTWQQFIDPEDYFCEYHCLRAKHGVTEECVRGAPNIPSIYRLLEKKLSNRVVASHTPFDRLALCQAARKYGLAELNSCSWLDTARVVRRAWPEFSQRGYGLANIASVLGIDFVHHVPAEDARAAGEVLLKAIADTGLSVEQWLVRASQPVRGRDRRDRGIQRDGDSGGPLVGEVVVFTGTLSISRSEAASMAAQAGCNVRENVTRDTTIVVVGDQDISRLAGHAKSAKHRKAQSLIGKGSLIRIMREADFSKLVSLEES